MEDHSDQKLLKEQLFFSIDSQLRKEAIGRGANSKGSMATESDSLALLVIAWVLINTSGVWGTLSVNRSLCYQTRHGKANIRPL